MTGTDFRDTAVYICDKGFKLVGDRERRCRSIGEWSSEEPSCVRKFLVYEKAIQHSYYEHML